MGETLDTKIVLKQCRSYDELLELAPNPYIYVGKQLTRSEIYAALWTAGITSATNLALDLAFGGVCPPVIKNSVLSVVAPVSEKPGLLFPFFFDSYAEQWDLDKDECKNILSKAKALIKKPRSRDKSLTEIIKKTWHDGWPILRADMMFHDSAYSSLQMGTMMMLSPESTAAVGILSGINFLAALTFAAFAEVKSTEWRYNRFRNKLKKANFNEKRYHESRFLISPRKDGDGPIPFFSRLMENFDLPKTDLRRIKDSYPREQHLEDFNKRKAYLRYRHRTDYKGDPITDLERIMDNPSLIDSLEVENKRNSIQFAHMLPKEFGQKELTLFKRYSSLKQKYSLVVDEGEDISSAVDSIVDRKVKKILKKHVKPGKDNYEIEFIRFIARNEKSIYATADIPLINGRPADSYFIELKVWQYSDVFKRAYEFIGKELPVDVTTKGKLDFLRTA